MNCKIYSSYGEPFNEMKDNLERLKVDFKTLVKDKQYFYTANLTKSQYDEMFRCSECVGGFVEVV